MVTDVSEREAQRMGVSRSKGMGYVPKTGRERKVREEADSTGEPTE